MREPPLGNDSSFLGRPEAKQHFGDEGQVPPNTLEHFGSHEVPPQSVALTHSFTPLHSATTAVLGFLGAFTFVAQAPSELARPSRLEPGDAGAGRGGGLCHFGVHGRGRGTRRDRRVTGFRSEFEWKT